MTMNIITRLALPMKQANKETEIKKSQSHTLQLESARLDLYFNK